MFGDEIAMLSIDTNILFYALNVRSPNHASAYAWLCSIPSDHSVAISEFILVELYRLLRNAAVLPRPLSAEKAVEIIQTYRHHPRWRLIGYPLEGRALHDAMWQRARHSDFAYRRVFDLRSALTMTAQGVTDFATANIKDFQNLGFRKVWNPLVG